MPTRVYSSECRVGGSTWWMFRALSCMCFDHLVKARECPVSKPPARDTAPLSQSHEPCSPHNPTDRSTNHAGSRGLSLMWNLLCRVHPERVTYYCRMERSDGALVVLVCCRSRHQLVPTDCYVVGTIFVPETRYSFNEQTFDE